jgi:hypothetical protein
VKLTGFKKALESELIRMRKETVERAEGEAFRALQVLKDSLSAGAVEFAHERGEGFDGFEGDGVVERDTQAAD